MKHDPRAHLTQHTFALVLAGGRGSRLHQLTDWRAKPAVPFAGKLRIIDFALSNCVNSGVRRIGVLTQYKAQSLIRHIERGWGFLATTLGEYVDVVPAQQQHGEGWYTGTANAVWQNLEILREAQPDHVLVLAGDHVYKMDYGVMLQEHLDRGAALSVACLEVPLAQACGFGVMGVDAQDRIVSFDEKPAQPAPLPSRPTHALASMGIYVFNAEMLIDELTRDAADAQSQHDFGHDIIPSLIHRERVVAHRFVNSCVNMAGDEPYWRDVGTLDAYWEANMDLTNVTPDLNLYDEEWPILSLQPQLAPAKFVFDDADRRGMAVDSLVAGGCVISGAVVRRSVVFSNSRIEDGASVEDAVLLPDVLVGPRARVRRAIIDMYCHLPPGFEVGLDPAADRARGFRVTDGGITLVTRDMLGQYRAPHR